MSENLDTDAPKSHPGLGNWITRCGPKSKASTVGLIILFGFMAAGVFLIVVGATVRPQPGSEAMAPIMKMGGVAMIAIGAVCLLFMALWKNPQIDLYRGGVRYKYKDAEHFISWAEMSSVLVTTVYDTRFSNYRMVKISRNGAKDLSFESKLRGEPDRIIDSIAKLAPNVVKNEIDIGA